MPTLQATLGETIWKLPPLILHPFNEQVPQSTILESSRATLMLAGLIPGDGSSPEEMERRHLRGRYGEIRMLCYLGKDVFRWIDQCVECIGRIPELTEAEVHEQSFAGLLTSSPPDSVREKLTRWRVVDHAAIFKRAIGLHAMFSEPPAFEIMASEFLNNYHRYADSLYRTFMDSEPHCPISCSNFEFELYASGEYSRLLESEWEE